MSKIKVLGIGSPFGNDQIGWEIIELLKQRKHIQQYIPKFLSIESHDRPGVRLLEIMKEANTIFLIDAVVSDNAIGTIYRFENEEIKELKCLLSTHGIGVAQTLELGRALNQLPNHIIFYGIEINSTELSCRISLLIESAIHQVVECIESEIIDTLKV